MKAVNAALTQRELQILELIALGYSDKEIGYKLKIAYCTIRSYVNKAVSKLHARNRTNAAIIYSLKNPYFCKNLVSKI